MELLYNPDVMPAAQVKATFVGRQWLVDELVALVQRQPDGAGVQHVVIIAPRGMGKTTVLLMIEFAIREGPAAAEWQAVRFSEESYDVTDLADFWMKTLSHLAADTQDAGLLERADQLKAEHADSDGLEEAALALIKDWRRDHNRRLVLLVDNFDLILSQINDERDNARLRNVLMNDGTLMLIGAATSFFREARAYDQPLYNFFKIYNLEVLKSPQIEELLHKRAKVDQQPHFEETVKANAPRLHALEYFTGGSPRLVLMLYRVIARSELLEVRHGLEKLLDEVTPYFKAKIESLPVQQRKILDHIARLSSQTHEGQTPTTIAQATRLAPNQVSAQLRRLSEEGYVRAANLRGRNSYYTLSEPLFAIWYQMRFGREARQRLQWLVDFLRAWYDAQEAREEAARLQIRFRGLLRSGQTQEAEQVLSCRRYLAEAMTDSLPRDPAVDSVVRSYLQLGDTRTLKQDLLPTLNLEDLSLGTLEALHEAGCLSNEQLSRARLAVPKTLKTMRIIDVAEYASQGIEARPDEVESWLVCGSMFLCAGMLQEALLHFERALAIKPDSQEGWDHRGVSLFRLRRYDEAVASFDRALEINCREQGCLDDRARILLNKFLAMVHRGKLDLAKQPWYEGVKAAEEIDLGRMLVFETLEVTARLGYVSFARELIEGTGIEKPLFPYARALEYLLSGDRGLIEKLSPEVRKIVEDIVTRLQSGDRQGGRKREPGRRKDPTGRRRHKHL